MKPFPPVLLLCLALGWQPSSGRAQVSTPAPLDAAITQLDTDLLALPAGSTVTDAQHQTIVADLNVLAVGVVPAPAATDIDAIATFLGNAAVAGNVTTDELVELNGDLAEDATDAADWTDDVSDDADVLLHPYVTDPGPITIEPFEPTQTGGLPEGDLTTTFVATAVAPSAYRARTSHRFTLDTQSGQSPSYQFYYGTAQLVTRQVAGAAATTEVAVEAVGVPLNNPYTVSVTRRSDGASVVLGKFNVKTATAQQFYLYLTANIPDTFRADAEIHSLGLATFGGNLKKPLPSGFDLADVASVTLTDSLGVARLSGMPRHASVNYKSLDVAWHLHGTSTLAPTASAVVKVERAGPAGHSGNRVHFSARNLPANTPVTLLADGVAVGQFTTRAHGRLLVTQGVFAAEYNRANVRVPAQTISTGVNLATAKSLALTDAQGNVLLDGSASGD